MIDSRNVDVLMKWFPILLFLSTMIFPRQTNLLAVTFVSIPMVICIWLAYALTKTEIIVPKRLLQIYVVVFFAQMILLFSGIAPAAEPMLLGLTWLLLGIFIWALMRDFGYNANTLFKSYIVVSMLWLVIALYVWLGFTDGMPVIFADHIVLSQPYVQKIAGAFKNGNVFSIMMLVAWCLSTSLLLQQEKGSRKYAAIGFLFLTVMFAGLSRGAWLTWMVILLFLLFQLIKKKQWGYVSWFLMSAFLAWEISLFMVDYVLQNMYLSNSLKNVNNVGVRITLYTTMFEMWKSHWLLGVGFGNLAGHFLTSQAAALSYLPDYVTSLGATNNAHNHFLHVLVESGIVGITLWGVVTFYFLKGFWLQRDAVYSPIWWSYVAAFALWFQGLFNVTMITPLAFFLFCIFLGLGMSSGQPFQFKESVIVNKKHSALFGVVGLLLAAQSVYVIQNGSLYTKLTYTESGVERGKVISELMDYPMTYPSVVSQVALDIMGRPEKMNQIVMFQSHIQKALHREEWPVLYQALFYTYVVQEDWQKACYISKFIRKQRWTWDINESAYDSACKGQKPMSFAIGPKKKKLESDPK